jgi:hypothetical protein
MKFMTTSLSVTAFLAASAAVSAANSDSAEVADAVIDAQRAALAEATADAGFGPQSPRDLRYTVGGNARVFSMAPAASQMNLCNIHFHDGAEHAGGQFSTFRGNGDGEGWGTGYVYDGDLTEAELTPLAAPIGDGAHGLLQSGQTIEVHFVHTTSDIDPGPTLGACLADSTGNPQLRVETQVMVLVNDADATDFRQLAKVEQVNGYWQAPNVPENTGAPITYLGSTTGPSYNEKASPFQVTWSVRPEVIKVDINTVGAWYADNIFDEDHAHGVRNLVKNVDLLSPITQ